MANLRGLSPTDIVPPIPRSIHTSENVEESRALVRNPKRSSFSIRLKKRKATHASTTNIIITTNTTNNNSSSRNNFIRMTSSYGNKRRPHVSPTSLVHEIPRQSFRNSKMSNHHQNQQRYETTAASVRKSRRRRSSSSCSHITSDMHHIYGPVRYRKHPHDTFNDNPPPPPFHAWRIDSLLANFIDPPHTRKKKIHSITNSTAWSLTNVICTLSFLFGPQIQTLWIHKNSDLLLDFLFIAFTIFAAFDLIFRCILYPQYFSINICHPSECRIHHQNNDFILFRLGSFLFWTDLLSIISILHGIPSLNATLRHIPTFHLTLHPSGISDYKVNLLSTLLGRIHFLFLVGRVARVARYMRPSLLTGLLSKVNWFWIFESFNPWFWLKSIQRSCSLFYCSCFQSCTRNITSIFTRTSRSGAETEYFLDDISIATSNYGPGSFRRIKELSSKKDDGWVAFFGLWTSKEHKFHRQHAAKKIQRLWKSYRHHQTATTTTTTIATTTTTTTTSEEDLSASGRIRSILSPVRRNSMPPQKKKRSRRRTQQAKSHVGSTIRDLTAERIGLGILIVSLLVLILTPSEENTSNVTTMALLHRQTQNIRFTYTALHAARETTIPTLFEYTSVDGKTYDYDIGQSTMDLRDREKFRIQVIARNGQSQGLISIRSQVRDDASMDIVRVAIIITFWLTGVLAFNGPVLTLVVTPIERIIHLLRFLTTDPLGYKSSPWFKKFMMDGDRLTKHTMWTQSALDGMETSFLMSTILRIGSLMKVGFGTAGVDIIRKNLTQDHSKDVVFLNTKGTLVSCIFLFCDIRQFTNATECLQEEVFVFTNKIAAVVHSYCNAYGGAANKNIGDAFLVTWALDKPLFKEDSHRTTATTSGADRWVSFDETLHQKKDCSSPLSARYHQADRALLSVINIIIALQFDAEFLGPLSPAAQARLLQKMSNHKGTLVQMGFGLHAGTAVQGAIGSQRKLDATYVAEAVEFAEFLESSTKKYGVEILISSCFHSLLQPGNQRRCRKISQIVIRDEYVDDDIHEYETMPDIYSLFTFDMDVRAIWRSPSRTTSRSVLEDGSGTVGENLHDTTLRPMFQNDYDNIRSKLKRHSSRRSIESEDSVEGRLKSKMSLARRRTFTPSVPLFQNSRLSPSSNAVLSSATREGGLGNGSVAGEIPSEISHTKPKQMPELPVGPIMYDSSVWLSPTMRKMRERYSDGIFFQKFNAGLHSFYKKDWKYARQCFETILERFDDGPSNYFLNIIKKNNGTPPRHFREYEEVV